LKGACHRALRIVPRADFFLWESIFPRNAYHRHQFLGKSEEQFSMKTSNPRNRSDPVSWIWFSLTWCSHKHKRQSFLSGTWFCRMHKWKLCSCNCAISERGEPALRITQNKWYAA
jgi:hypothetical protein